MKHAKEYLKLIGVDSDTIDNLFKEELEEDFVVSDKAKDFVKKSRTLAKDDPELIRTIRDEIRGTELSKIEHKIKKTFDLSADDVRDKKFDEILDVAKEKVQASAGSTNEELQTKIVELNNKVKNYEEEVLPAERKKATDLISNFRKESSLSAALAKRANTLIVLPEAILPAINNKLQAEYNVTVNDSGELEVKTKDGLNPLNKEGTKQITFDEIIDGYLSDLKVVKQSNGNPNGSGSGNGSGNGSGSGSGNGGNDDDGKPKFNLRGLNKAQQNAENLKEMKVFGSDGNK